MNKKRIYAEKIKNAENVFFYLLEKEIEAKERLERAERALFEQQNCASHPSADDETVEAFSRWLRIGREEISDARETLSLIILERDLLRRGLVDAFYCASFPKDYAKR